MMELHEENKLMREALTGIAEACNCCGSRADLTEMAAECLVAVGPAAQPEHRDDAAIDNFAVALKAKMADSRAKGRNGWDDPTLCPDGVLPQMLREHVAKGDPRDVGVLAMMCWARNESTAAQPEGEATLRNPHTGQLRDYRDVESDPAGILCVKPGDTLRAAPQAGDALGSIDTPELSKLIYHFANGTLKARYAAIIDHIDARRREAYDKGRAEGAGQAKTMSVPQVADMLREKNLLTESGMKTFLNGDALRFHPGDIARIINAAFDTQQVPK